MSNNEELAIEVENLSFSLGGSLILENLNLKLHKGSRCLLVGNRKKIISTVFCPFIVLLFFYTLFFTALGANGAGKSTLLTILAGKRMVQNKVLVFGKDSFKNSPPVSNVCSFDFECFKY